MSLIIRDGFDFYAAIADAGQNYWDAVDSSQASLSTNTRFGVGQALNFGTGSGSGQINLQKAFGSNESTAFVVFTFIYPVAFSGTSEFESIRFYDNSTVQCSITFKSNGDINFYRGDRSTLLGTWSAGYSANSFTQVQIKVVFSGSVGSFEVRKNGNTSDDYSLSSVNNITTANAYANKIDFIKNLASPTANLIVDDLAIFGGSGSGTWTTWIGDIRAVQIMPNADTATKHFTPNAATLVLGLVTATSTRSFSANTQYSLQKYVSTLPGTVSKVTLSFNAAVTGHVNVAIFDSTGAGGGPGSVIANGTATAVTNPVINNNDFSFATPPTLATNTTYWFMAIADAAFVLKSDGTSAPQYTESRTYGSGFDSPMSLSSVTGATSSVALTVTPSGNFAYVQELHEDGTVSYVADATVGDKDLYTSAGLSATPASILGLSLRGFVAKSDAGARSAAMTMTSGATVQDGSTFVLSTTLQNLVMVQDVDPATSAAWTATGVNNLNFGQKVAA